MKKKLVFLTGAGVSKESGIDTFRDAGGLWEGHNVMDVASIQGWRKNKQLVLDFYNKRRSILDTVEPNNAHKLITELENYYDVIVITQNVDNLHEKAGSTNVIHLHGELSKACSSNNKKLTVPYTSDINVGDKHEDGSQLRPFIVWFGEDVPMISTAIKEIQDADIAVIVGTSLNVYPAADLITYAPEDVVIYYIDPNPLVNKYTAHIKLIRKVATEGMEELFTILK